MTKVVGVRFKPHGQIYYFNPGKLKLKDNLTVIVETEHGLQFGSVVNKDIEISDSKIQNNLKEVIRIATKTPILLIIVAKFTLSILKTEDKRLVSPINL